MDIRGIAAVLLKVTGLVLIAVSVTQLPGYFPVSFEGDSWEPSVALTMAAITMGPVVLLGVALWFFPGAISNKIVSASEAKASNDDLMGLQAIAIATLGLYLVAHGVADLAYHVVTTIQLQRQNPGYDFIPATVLGGTVAAVAQVIIGALFAGGSRGLASRIRPEVGGNR
jgi:hypothetical protein